MQRRKEEAKKRYIHFFIRLFIWQAAALLSAKVADVSSFSSDFYKTYGRLLFNFMFSLQEARLLLPGLRGLQSK